MKTILVLALFATVSGLVMGITHTMYDFGGILFFGGIATAGFCTLFIKKPRGPEALLLNIIGLLFASIPGTITILILLLQIMHLRLNEVVAQILFGFILCSLLILKAKQSSKKPSC